MTALYFGYDKGYAVQRSPPDVRAWLQVLAIITVILSLIGALRSLSHQFRTSLQSLTQK